MLVSEVYDSKYLKADDIKNHRVPVEIEEVGLVEFDGKVSFLLSFKGKKKQMRLNKTNGLELRNMLGEDTDDWVGATAILATQVTQFKGKPTRGLVLLNVIPNPNPKPKQKAEDTDGDGDDADIPF